MEVLIAEEVLLILFDDKTGKYLGARRNIVIGTALLAELALGGALALVGERTTLHDPRLEVVPGVGVTDDVLARVLGCVDAESLEIPKAISAVGKEFHTDVTARMVGRGWVTEERHTILGLHPHQRYPARDTSYEAGLRARISSVLVDGHSPDHRLATVIAVIDLIGVTASLVDHRGVSRRVVAKRADQARRVLLATDVLGQVLTTAARITAPSGVAQGF